MREARALLCLALVGCAPHPGAPAKVQRLGATDLRCGRSELTAIRLKNDAYRIRGCGQEATYAYMCARGICEWRIDDPPRPLPAAGNSVAR